MTLIVEWVKELRGKHGMRVRLRKPEDQLGESGADTVLPDRAGVVLELAFIADPVVVTIDRFAGVDTRAGVRLLPYELGLNCDDTVVGGGPGRPVGRESAGRNSRRLAPSVATFDGRIRFGSAWAGNASKTPNTTSATTLAATATSPILIRGAGRTELLPYINSFRTLGAFACRTSHADS
jgi:hypothetical protein